MEFAPLDRDPSRSRTALSAIQVTAMCERAFGKEVDIISARELAGGTFSTTFVITLKDGSKTILRVAPPSTTDVFWAHTDPMRRKPGTTQANTGHVRVYL